MGSNSVTVNHLFTYQDNHCVKSVLILSFSGLYFPAFGLNMERYGIAGKYGPEKTPNTDTSHAVHNSELLILWRHVHSNTNVTLRLMYYANSVAQMPLFFLKKKAIQNMWTVDWMLIALLLYCKESWLSSPYRARNSGQCNWAQKRVNNMVGGTMRLQRRLANSPALFQK